MAGWTRAIAVGWALASSACGADCPRERAALAEVRAAAPADTEPDAAIEVPFALLEALLSQALATSPVVPLPAAGLSKLTLVPKDVRLRPAERGLVGLTLTLDVLRAGERLLTLAGDLEVRPTFDAANHRLELALGPEVLRKVALRLGPSAREALARLVRAQLPAAAEALLRPRLAALTDRAASALVDATYGLLRDGELARRLPRTSVGFAVPGLPAQGIEVTSVPGLLRVGLDLGAAGRVPAGARPLGPGPRVRISGEGVARLGNQAIAAGTLPDRYDDRGRPASAGPYRVGLGWGEAPRPLKVLAWQTEGTCVHARFGGTPELALEGAPRRSLVLRVRDGEVEAVEGSAWVEAGAWLTGVWDRTLRFTHRAVAEAQVDVAGRALAVAVVDARATAGAVEFDLAVTDQPTQR